MVTVRCRRHGYRTTRMIVNVSKSKKEKNCEKKPSLPSRPDASRAPAASTVAAAVSVVAVCHCSLVAFHCHVVPVVCDGDAVVGTIPYTRLIVNVSKSKKEKKIVKKKHTWPLLLLLLFLWWRFVIVCRCSLVVEYP